MPRYQEYTNRCELSCQEAVVTNVIIQVGTNHLPRDHPSNITTKISKLLLHATKEFPNTSIYFSTILPKFNNTFFEMINQVNSEIFELRSYYHQLRFIQHQDFPKIHEMNKEIFWKDMIHASNNGLRQSRLNFSFYVVCWYITYCSLHYLFYFCKTALSLNNLAFKWSLDWKQDFGT